MTDGLLVPLQRTGSLRVLRTDITMLLTERLQDPDDTKASDVSRQSDQTFHQIRKYLLICLN